MIFIIVFVRSEHQKIPAKFLLRSSILFSVLFTIGLPEPLIFH